MRETRVLNVEVDGATLFVESIGPSHPRVALLLAGAAMQATTWEDVFVDRLVAADVGVVRFDWRDIGRSTWRRFRDAPYTVEDLANDVVAVAAACDVVELHLVGFSMGGCVAQLVALSRPSLVRSLALLSSGFASTVDAPRSARARALLEAFGGPRPADDSEHVARLVEQWRILCGRAFPFDEDTWTQRAQAWVGRGQNPSCPHIRLGPQVFGVDRTQALASLDLPALIVHGTDDPMFPHQHAEALHRALPNARLELLDGRGHELHLDAAVASRVVDHILATSSHPAN